MPTKIARTFFFFAALSLSAAAASDYSGRWKLDPLKSTLSGAYADMRQERVIEHKEPELKIAITVFLDGEKHVTTARYTTDGKESRNSVGGSPMTSIVTWDGAALVFKSSVIQETDTFELHDRWTLSEDGKRLTIKRKQRAADDERELTFVFDRV